MRLVNSQRTARNGWLLEMITNTPCHSNAFFVALTVWSDDSVIRVGRWLRFNFVGIYFTELALYHNLFLTRLLQEQQPLITGSGFYLTNTSKSQGDLVQTPSIPCLRSITNPPHPRHYITHYHQNGLWNVQTPTQGQRYVNPLKTYLSITNQ